MPKRTDISSILIIGACPKNPSPHGGRGWRASARRVRGRNQGRRDRRPDAIEIFQNIVIPEAKDLEALAFEKCRSTSVALNRVLATVDFDDQAPLRAKKIGDVTADLNLTTEFEAVELPVAEDAPQPLFSVRGLPAQRSRPACQVVVPCHFAPSPQPSPAEGRGSHATPSPSPSGATLSRKGERGSFVNA